MCFGKRSCCTTLVVILAVISRFIASSLIKLGVFSSITIEQEHGNTNCEILTNKNKHIAGCEDIAQFEDGSIILSCANNSFISKEIFSPKAMSEIIQQNSYTYHGYLFFMKNINSLIDSDEFAEIKLLNRVSPDFHPHGINVITDKSNTQWIYLINHRRDGDFVEIYQFNKNTKEAIFKDEIHSPLFIFINDLKAVLLDVNTNKIGFYVTNSYAFPLKTKLNILESVLELQQTDLLFCEPDTFKYKDKYNANANTNSFKSQWKCVIVDMNTGFGNGIDISMDGKSLFVVETIQMKIIVYDRNTKTNALKRRDTIALNSAGDNLYLDRQTGDLYIGSHKNMLQFMKHTMDFSVIAPSQILHWNSKTGELKEIYLSNGHTKNHVSGSSVGIYDVKSKMLLIGTVNAETMRCQL